MAIDTTHATSTAHRTANAETGTGEPALLLLPGWCGDRTVVDRVLTRGVQEFACRLA